MLFDPDPIGATRGPHALRSIFAGWRCFGACCAPVW